MTVTAIRIICCILYGAASVSDEREMKIPRLISYLECLSAFLCWCIRFLTDREFSVGNLVVSLGFLGIFFAFYRKGQIGLGDVFLVFSMLVLMSCGQQTMALLWKENIFFCIAFFSAGVRLLVQRFGKKRENAGGCPFAIHLFAAFLFVEMFPVLPGK